MNLIHCKNIIIIVTIRNDYISEFTSYKELNDVIRKNIYTLGDINFSHKIGDNRIDANSKRILEDIITLPALRYDVTINKLVVNKIIEEALESSDLLPALQLILVALWESKKTNEKIDGDDFLDNKVRFADIISHNLDQKIDNYIESEIEKYHHIEETIKNVF